MSAQPCGCDPDHTKDGKPSPWVCEWHRKQIDLFNDLLEEQPLFFLDELATMDEASWDTLLARAKEKK